MTSAPATAKSWQLKGHMLNVNKLYFVYDHNRELLAEHALKIQQQNLTVLISSQSTDR
jgi:hypothetical protein